DPKQMKEWTPNSKYGGHAFGFLDFKTFLNGRDSVLPLLAEYSPYSLVTKDDPPVYLIYSAPPSLGQDQRDPTHTSNFGVKLKEHCQENDVSCELVYPDAPDVLHANATAFLVEKLSGR
ncbi:MAG: alpha/beta hydrolase, partial [Gammaproteobacteria bacterium]|nr:alpha/beta hydrolase [Gammaproteobacteria bacterium]